MSCSTDAYVTFFNGMQQVELNQPLSNLHCFIICKMFSPALLEARAFASLALVCLWDLVSTHKG